MIEFLSEMQFWHWMVFGFALMAVEALAPGAFFLWPGLAAILVGLIVGLIPSLPWTASVGLWAVLSVVTAVAWIYYRRKNPSGATPLSMLNRRGEQYIGQRFTLDKPVINGKGEMKVADTIWRVTSKTDIPAGTPVRVVAVEGTSLCIEEI